MKLKLDENGHVVVQDGKPVYVDDSGKDVAFDAPATIATISRLNGEAKGHRERAEALETKLKPFEGITDPEAARKALKTVQNLDDRKLVEAGEVEKVKEEAIKAVRAEFEPVVKERDKFKADLFNEKIGGSFARSKFIGEKVNIPADMLQARFGQNFEVKDGKIIAKHADGREVFSKSRPGELADFEEAIEILVDQYPQKDHILKGAGGGGGRDGKSGTILKGQDLSKLSPTARLDAAREAQAAA